MHPILSRRTTPTILCSLQAYPSFIAIALIFLLVGCDKSAPGTSTEQPTLAAAQQVQEFYVNDTVNGESLQTTLTDVQTGKHIQATITDAQAAEGGMYVVVSLKIKNIGTKPITAFEMPKITLIDVNGNHYDSDLNATMAAHMALGDTSKVLSDLNPDLTVTKIVAFEVSEKAFDPTTWRLQVGEHITYHLTQSPNSKVSSKTVATAEPEQEASAVANSESTAAQSSQSDNFQQQLPDLSKKNPDADAFFEKVIARAPASEQTMLRTLNGKRILTGAMTISHDGELPIAGPKDHRYDQIAVSEDREIVCIQYKDSNQMEVQGVYSGGLLMAPPMYGQLCEETDTKFFDVANEARNYRHLFNPK